VGHGQVDGFVVEMVHAIGRIAISAAFQVPEGRSWRFGALVFLCQLGFDFDEALPLLLDLDLGQDPSGETGSGTAFKLRSSSSSWFAVSDRKGEGQGQTAPKLKSFIYGNPTVPCG
jgi:hypothetical protein